MVCESKKEKGRNNLKFATDFNGQNLAVNLSDVCYGPNANMNKFSVQEAHDKAWGSHFIYYSTSAKFFANGKLGLES